MAVKLMIFLFERILGTNINLFEINNPIFSDIYEKIHIRGKGWTDIHQSQKTKNTSRCVVKNKRALYVQNFVIFWLFYAFNQWEDNQFPFFCSNIISRKSKIDLNDFDKFFFEPVLGNYIDWFEIIHPTSTDIIQGIHIRDRSIL